MTEKRGERGRVHRRGSRGDALLRRRKRGYGGQAEGREDFGPFEVQGKQDARIEILHPQSARVQDDRVLAGQAICRDRAFA
jgi:hypothetical protein